VEKFAHVKMQGEGTFVSANVTPDAKTLITGGSNSMGRLDQVWDLTAASPPRQLKSFTRGLGSARMTLSPDGKLAMIYSTRLVEVVDWEEDRAVLLKEPPPSADFSGVTFNSDSKMLITGHADGKVRFLEIPSGKELGSFPARHRANGNVTGLSLSADGKFLSTGVNSHVSIWSMGEVFPRKN
jgi:WD40 repeat protein